eukprot:2787985-Ditylum_brightwellii.AAC.1
MDNHDKDDNSDDLFDKKKEVEYDDSKYKEVKSENRQQRSNCASLKKILSLTTEENDFISQCTRSLPSNLQCIVLTELKFLLGHGVLRTACGKYQCKDYSFDKDVKKRYDLNKANAILVQNAIKKFHRWKLQRSKDDNVEKYFCNIPHHAADDQEDAKGKVLLFDTANSSKCNKFDNQNISRFVQPLPSESRKFFKRSFKNLKREYKFVVCVELDRLISNAHHMHHDYKAYAVDLEKRYGLEET